jgi:hypothetical protein
MLSRFFKSLMLEPPKTEDGESIGAFGIPENDAILRQLNKSALTYSYDNQIKEIRGRVAIMRHIEGHPDLHEYLWQRAGADLPMNARWIVCGHATLVHPQTKIIFAIAQGTHSIRIKIPISELQAFPELLREVETDALHSSAWVSSCLNENQDKQLLKIAFDAVALPPSQAPEDKM